MSQMSHSPDIFVRYADEFTGAARRAVQQAVWEHQQLGVPVCGLVNGQIVIIAPDQIGVSSPNPPLNLSNPIISLYQLAHESRS